MVYAMGDAKSPVLFNLALESMIRKVLRTESLTLRDGNISSYADDIVIIGKIQKKKLKTSMMKKTKHMKITRKIKTLRDITIINNKIVKNS